MNLIRINSDLSPHVQSLVASALELYKKDRVTYVQLFSGKLLERVSIPALNGFGWWGKLDNPNEYDIPKLKLLRKLTIADKFIFECNYDKVFEPYFIDGKTPKGKLQCREQANTVAVLFRNLQLRGIIPGSCKIYDLLSIAFVDKNGKPLKRDSLERMASRGVSVEEQKAIDDLLVMLMA